MDGWMDGCATSRASLLRLRRAPMCWCCFSTASSSAARDDNTGWLLMSGLPACADQYRGSHTCFVILLTPRGGAPHDHQVSDRIAHSQSHAHWPVSEVSAAAVLYLDPCLACGATFFLGELLRVLCATENDVPFPKAGDAMRVKKMLVERREGVHVLPRPSSMAKRLGVFHVNRQSRASVLLDGELFDV